MKTRNYMIAGVLAVGIVAGISNMTVKADPAATSMKSHGRIAYDNKTPDNTADDIIIFDADDLKLLETKLAGIETRINAAKQNLN